MDEADVVQRARTFVSKVNISNISEDLTAYVIEAKAKLRSEELELGEAGYTITKPDGNHIVTVNSLDSEERQRFTICHEIAHIVLGLPSSHEEIPSWSYAKRELNEVWCDIFAAELLMPYQIWKAAVEDTEPSIEVIEELAQNFKTSFPAAASRYASLSSTPCAYVTMEKGTIRYASRSTVLRRVNAWISPKSPIPPGSVSHRIRATEQNGFDSGNVAQDVWFENWQKGSELVEIARHYAQYDITVALLWFSDDDLPEVDIDRFGKRVIDDNGPQELTGELPWPDKRRRK